MQDACLWRRLRPHVVTTHYLLNSWHHCLLQFHTTILPCLHRRHCSVSMFLDGDEDAVWKIIQTFSSHTVSRLEVDSQKNRARPVNFSTLTSRYSKSTSGKIWRFLQYEECTFPDFGYKQKSNHRTPTNQVLESRGKDLKTLFNFFSQRKDSNPRNRTSFCTSSLFRVPSR